MNDRLFPPRPILAASVAVFQGGRVLIARRARAPMLGLYSLPGGVVEIGETLQQAALRELDEEVGLDADIIAFVDHVEPIAREGEQVRTHFVIAVFVARWRAGEPRLSDEADDAIWISPEAIDTYSTTPELPRLIRRAAEIERSHP